MTLTAQTGRSASDQNAAVASRIADIRRERRIQLGSHSRCEGQNRPCTLGKKRPFATD